MGSESVGVIALALVTAAFLLFVAIELGGLTLPGFHTISFLAYHHQPLRFAILLTILLFAGWWWLHSGSFVAK